MDKRELSLRERTRRAVRAEIVEAAMTLFLRQGFEATTVDDIAQAAGISRRSYFRYFASKDEVFAEGLTSWGESIAEALADRPATESPWLALRRSFDPLVEQADRDPNAEALGRLMLERSALRQGKDAIWQSRIAATLLSRLSSDDARNVALRAETLAAAAITCLHIAQVQWLTAEERRPLSDLLDTTMTTMRPLT